MGGVSVEIPWHSPPWSLTQRRIQNSTRFISCSRRTRCPCCASVYHPLVKPAVSINAAIPQKWPMRALLVYALPCHISDHNLFLVNGTFCYDFAVRPANKALPPKFNAIATSGRFMADAVWDCDIAAVRDCVTALDGFPGGMLRCAELLLFRRMPADCRRIKNNLRAVKRGQARRFRIPLVTADTNAYFALCFWPRSKSEIAWRKIEFLVIQRVVRDMHLAVFAEQFSIRVNDCRGVVINASAAFLEK